MRRVIGMMVLGGVAALSAASASASLYPRYIRAHYPKSIQPLMLKVNALDDECRGRGDDPATARACRQRDVAMKQLERRGWCWGSTNRNADEADMTYLLCSKDRTRPLQ